MAPATHATNRFLSRTSTMEICPPWAAMERFTCRSKQFLNNRTNLGVGAPPRTCGVRGLEDGRHPCDELRHG